MKIIKLIQTVIDRLKSLITNIKNKVVRNSDVAAFNEGSSDNEWVKVNDDRPIDWETIELVDAVKFVEDTVFNPWINKYNGMSDSDYSKEFERLASIGIVRNENSKPLTRHEEVIENDDIKDSDDQSDNVDKEDIDTIRKQNHDDNAKNNTEKIRKMISDENPDDPYISEQYTPDGNFAGFPRWICYYNRNRPYAVENKDVSWNDYDDTSLFFCFYYDPVDVYDMYDYEKTEDGFIPNRKYSDEEHAKRLYNVPLKLVRITLKELYDFMRTNFIRTDYLISPAISGGMYPESHNKALAA